MCLECVVWLVCLECVVLWYVYMQLLDITYVCTYVCVLCSVECVYCLYRRTVYVHTYVCACTYVSAACCCVFWCREGRVQEHLLCHSIIGRNPLKELIMTVDMAATFISPLLEVSQRALHFTAVLVSQKHTHTHIHTHTRTCTHKSNKNVL